MIHMQFISLTLIGRINNKIFFVRNNKEIIIIPF